MITASLRHLAKLLTLTSKQDYLFVSRYFGRLKVSSGVFSVLAALNNHNRQKHSVPLGQM